ncbi:hypothetical protein NL676_001482 [Syzygium grande]|nr:hypothetical protein NL676_001482 [Syzygium grande]
MPSKFSRSQSEPARSALILRSTGKVFGEMMQRGVWLSTPRLGLLWWKFCVHGLYQASRGYRRLSGWWRSWEVEAVNLILWRIDCYGSLSRDGRCSGGVVLKGKVEESSIKQRGAREKENVFVLRPVSSFDDGTRGKAFQRCSSLRVPEPSPEPPASIIESAAPVLV